MSIPYFPLYPSDFEADTAHLTLEEDGAYNRLLRLCWRTSGCSIPDDRKWIMRKMRVTAEDYDRVIDPIIDEYFTRAMGRISNARLCLEFAKISELKKSRSNAGKKGVVAKALKNNKKPPSKANVLLKQPEPEPEPDNQLDTSVSNLPAKSGNSLQKHFEEFWNIYPHRGGAKKGRKPSQAKFEVAVKNGADPVEIVRAAKEYRNDRAVLDGYGKNPEVWLNQGRWQDEIEPVKIPQMKNGGQYDKPASKSQERTNAFISGARGVS